VGTGRSVQVQPVERDVYVLMELKRPLLIRRVSMMSVSKYTSRAVRRGAVNVRRAGHTCELVQRNREILRKQREVYLGPATILARHSS
jgi:hypothetical protein